jgi:tetrathionate reductase subunit B
LNYRRHFIQRLGAILTVTATTAVTAKSALAFSRRNPGRDGQDSRYAGHQGKHWIMAIDLRKCVGCQACTAACKAENKVPERKFRTWTPEYELGTYPHVRKAFLPQLCNHCDLPACTSVCPTGATFKRQDGVVLVDANICWGCGYCLNACPYDKRYINQTTQVADKCTFCAHRIDAGLLPACTESCVGGARLFGDLNEQGSEVARLLRQFPSGVLNPSMGTRPQVFYVGLSGELLSAPAGLALLDDIARRRDGVPTAEWAAKG